MNMIVFDFREAEKKFFEENNFQDFNITFFSESLNKNFVETLPEDLLENTNIISVFITSDVTDEVIDKFKNLRIISTRSTGYNHISVNSCQYKNIAVTNVVNYGETSVAQFTFGLIIALVRNITKADRVMRKLEVPSGDFVGRDLSKLTLGVVGTGAIGSAVCNMGKNFGMKLIGYDINPKSELVENLKLNYVSLEELVQNSDVVSLHLPYTGDNYHMFNHDLFTKFKENSYFINTSRGELVDVEALYNQMENKRIAGAALDVLTCESLCFNCYQLSQKMNGNNLDCFKEALYVEKLTKSGNFILTPHIAYETQDSIDYILEKTMENIKNIIVGDKLCRIV